MTTEEMHEFYVSKVADIFIKALKTDPEFRRIVRSVAAKTYRESEKKLETPPQVNIKTD